MSQKRESGFGLFHRLKEFLLELEGVIVQHSQELHLLFLVDIIIVGKRLDLFI
jgi:hypothetical protein